MDYELICEFVHCKGPVRAVVGMAGSEAAARQWVEHCRQGGEGGFGNLDPNCDCPVACCAMRGQPPRFIFRVRSL